MDQFNMDWKFKLGEELCGHLIDLDEKDFREVSLPHDFSIEQPYNEELGDGCTGYLVGGMGWYRKTLDLPADVQGKKVFVVFDGIYNRSNIYFNEHFMKFQPYGYVPCVLDVSEYVQAGKNVIAVQVDHTRYADSRWYTGSGIYRKANMYILDKNYIPVWGIKVNTDTTDLQNAKVGVTTKVNRSTFDGEIVLKTTVVAPNGDVVFYTEEQVSEKNENEVITTLEIANPILWDVYAGNRYNVVSTLLENGKVLQEERTIFGIRHFEFTVDQGFFINGRHEYIKGVCLHHDAGLVGTAVPKDVWRRRLETLVEAGVNAIRTAHNPASEEFLDLCDDMGLLVQEEFYDECDFPKDKRYNMKDQKVDYITRGHSEFFKDYAEVDLKAVMYRDINHPSIVQWSIGNEIEWTYPKYNIATGYFGASANGNYFWDEPPYTVEEIRENVKKLPRELYEVGDTAQKLAKWTREIDTTRPVVANCILPSASYESGYADALDVVGFSYRQVVYDRCHNAYPDKPIMGTENLPQWHEWKHVLEKPYLAGIFLWTGIDYIGESGNSDVWPRKAMASGLLDVAGFKKPSFYMFKSLWQDKPSVYMVTQKLEKSLYNLEEGQLVEKEDCKWQKRMWVWHDMNEHYNYNEGEEVVVEVYSNCECVTLYHNGVEVSTLLLADQEDHIYKWHVPFTSGALKAVGKMGEKTVEYMINTASTVSNVDVVVDRTELVAFSDEVCNLEIQLLDEMGNKVSHEEAEVGVTFNAPVKYYGIDNGSKNFVGDHSAEKITTNQGKALVVFGSVSEQDIEVTVFLNGKSVKVVKVKA